MDERFVLAKYLQRGHRIDPRPERDCPPFAVSRIDADAHPRLITVYGVALADASLNCSCLFDPNEQVRLNAG
jgi:hypothetical protein